MTCKPWTFQPCQVNTTPRSLIGCIRRPSPNMSSTNFVLSMYVCVTILTSFARSSCPPQLPTIFEVCERGQGRRPPHADILRSCHTSFCGFKREDVLAWPAAIRRLFLLFLLRSELSTKCNPTVQPHTAAGTSVTIIHSHPQPRMHRPVVCILPQIIQQTLLRPRLEPLATRPVSSHNLADQLANSLLRASDVCEECASLHLHPTRHFLTTFVP